MTREITKITETPEADRDEWRTPPEVFALAERLVGRSFDLDAAADKANALCRWWCGPTQIGDLEHLKDGLLAEWRYHERVWCNPPFSRGNLPRWTLKAVHEAIGGCTSCLLLPFTGDDWFCQNVVGRAQRSEERRVGKECRL